MSEPVELTLRDDEAGQRLDKVLAARELGFSRAALQRWIAEGRITVDGQPAVKDAKAQAGAAVRIEPAPPSPSRAEPEDISLGGPVFDLEKLGWLNGMHIRSLELSDLRGSVAPGASFPDWIRALLGARGESTVDRIEPGEDA